MKAFKYRILISLVLISVFAYLFNTSKKEQTKSNFKTIYDDSEYYTETEEQIKF